jgi:hypothetical protein
VQENTVPGKLDDMRQRRVAVQVVLVVQGLRCRIMADGVPVSAPAVTRIESGMETRRRVNGGGDVGQQRRPRMLIQRGVVDAFDDAVQALIHGFVGEIKIILWDDAAALAPAYTAADDNR